VALKPGQFATEIEAEDILELCRNHEPESIFIEFKQTLFVKIPEENRKVIDDQIDDTLADIVAFSNARGGHIIVGIEESGNRAEKLAPLTKDDAARIATIIRDRAAVFIKPSVSQLQSASFPIDIDRDKWVVVVTIPPQRPVMSSFREQTRFAIRDGDRKRSMSSEEIREAFLENPRSNEIRDIYFEMKALRSLIEQALQPKIGDEEP